MNEKQIVFLFSSLLLLVCAAFAMRAIELEDASARIAEFPSDGPQFHSVPVELTDFEKDMLGSAMGYKWIYQWKGFNYAITIIDGTRNRQAVHDPRYCFLGAGWEIVDEQRIDFSGGKARRVELLQDETRSEALFFYSDGTVVFDAPLQYWFRATVRRWLRQFGGSEPVLVMVQPIESGLGLDQAIAGFLPLLPSP